jgi:hypothetical protein
MRDPARKQGMLSVISVNSLAWAKVGSMVMVGSTVACAAPVLPDSGLGPSASASYGTEKTLSLDSAILSEIVCDVGNPLGPVPNVADTMQVPTTAPGGLKMAVLPKNPALADVVSASKKCSGLWRTVDQGSRRRSESPRSRKSSAGLIR